MTSNCECVARQALCIEISGHKTNINLQTFYRSCVKVVQLKKSYDKIIFNIILSKELFRKRYETHQLLAK